jgi:hypothetical protein
MSSTKVSIQTIIGNVIGNLGIRNVNNVIDDFARWAVDAELKIGSQSSYKRFECEIDVKDRRACLPDNYISLIAVKERHKDYKKEKKEDLLVGIYNHMIQVYQMY